MSVRVTVIGAGVFGAWTAWHLRRGGAEVRLIEQRSPGHALASSGGESRIIRMGYGADEIYTRMAMRSLPQWKELFARVGQPLFHRTGVLWIARPDDPTAAMLARAGVPHEILDAPQLAARYPQMRIEDPCVRGVLEPESGALMARRAVAAVVEDAVRAGVEYVTGSAPPLEGIRVFACGPWLPKLFPELLGNRIRPTRQEVFYFASPPGWPPIPIWIDFSDPRGPYGFPDLEGRGVKLAFDRHGAEIDPDTMDRVASRESIAEAREFLAGRFPALRDAPLAETRVCQYENTSSGDFLIDRHPEFEDVWLVGGGSGHGFKHGPAVGEHVAARVLRGEAAEPRFTLATKSETPKRAVF
jgi:glycine/D-amino acid oxidase-like deaminating enzyme